MLWVVLILLGTFLRGPNWNFFGPYEYWDLHKLIPLNNVNLSDIVWVQLLGTTEADQHPGPRAAGHPARAWRTSCSRRSLMYRLFFKKYIAQAGMLRYLDPGGAAPVHGRPADQDGAPLDDEPEIPGGDPGILLQYLNDSSSGPAMPRRRASDRGLAVLPDSIPTGPSTMPASEETYRSQPNLHLVFAITSVAMLLSFVWMIVADHLRPWKEVQRQFQQVEREKLEAPRTEEARGAEAEAPGPDRGDRRQDQGRPRPAREQRAAELRELEPSSTSRAARSQLGLDTQKRFKKAELDSQRSLYDGMIDAGEEPQARAI